jgi:hypothetical protein
MEKMISIKNWLSIVKQRGYLELSEVKSFSDEILKLILYIEEIENRLHLLEQQKSNNAMKRSSINSEYIQSVISRIDILKNLMKSSVEDENSTLFSPQLVLVESMENDIKESNTVSTRQLETLNEIYQNYRKMMSKT